MYTTAVVQKEVQTLLTNQEKKVIALIADGYSSKQIAHQLYISEHTVVNHRKNMLYKTRTKNVAELVAFVIRNEVI